MNILDAAKSETVLQAALNYAALGISVIPTIGKRPAIRIWMGFQRRRANSGQIRFWDAQKYLENVAVICGVVSGNLVVLDLDSSAAVEKYEARWPNLLDTYTVQTGKGQHLYYYVDVLPPTTRVTQTEYAAIELRANGCYVIAPPSVHPSGKRYQPLRELPVMRLRSMQDMVTWIKGLIAEKHGGHMPPPSRPAHTVTNPDAYALAALRGEADKVRGAAVGGRNQALNLAAFKMGRLIREGRLSRYQVESVLFAAAGGSGHVADDGERAIVKTINAAIDAGIQKAGLA